MVILRQLRVIIFIRAAVIGPSDSVDSVGHTCEFEAFQKMNRVKKKPDRFFKDYRRPWLAIAAAEDANDLQTDDALRSIIETWIGIVTPRV